MSKTLEGMARVHYGTFAEVRFENVLVDDIDRAAMKAALLWLADNVSDEMVEAAAGRLPHFAKVPDVDVKDAISAALRAAGDGR